MITRKITVYYETGYDTVNIPDQQALFNMVNTAKKSEHYSNSMTQRGNLATIALRTEGEIEAERADFLQIDTSFYNITGYSFTSEGTVIYSLQENYLAELLYEYGDTAVQLTATRITPTAEENNKINSIAEPFSPVDNTLYQTRIEDLPVKLRNDNLGYKDVIGATVNLADGGLKKTLEALTYVDEDNDLAVSVPQIPEITKGTLIEGKEIRGEQFFDLDSVITKKNLRIVNSLGINGTILDAYRLPEDYAVFYKKIPPVESGYQPAGFSEIKSKVNGVTKKYNYKELLAVPVDELKNKKAASLFAKARLRSKTSGDTVEIPLNQLYTEYGENIPVSFYCDVLPSGKPYAYFGENNPANALVNGVQGTEWYHPNIVYGGATNTAVSGLQTRIGAHDATMNSNRNAILAAQTLELMRAGKGYTARQATQNIAQNGLDLVTGIAGGNYKDALSGGFGLFNAVDQTQQQAYQMRATENALESALQGAQYNTTAIERDAQNALTISENIYTPAMKQGTGTPALSFNVSNNFTLDVWNITWNDMKRLDRFLTAYGVAVPNEIITLADIKKRGSNFCYISGSDINFSDSRLSRYKRDGIRAQLSGGVRIWHKTPTAITDNDII